MGLHDEAAAVAVKPCAAVSGADIDEVKRSIVFGGPAFVFDLADSGIDEDDASRPQEGDHTAIFKADIAVTVVPVPVGERAFEVGPAFDHAREIFGALRIKTGIKTHRDA